MKSDPIFEAVKAEFGVSPDQLRAPTRSTADVAWARQIAAYVCYVLWPGVSWAELGRTFDRDRTTMRYAVNKVQERIAREPELKSKVERIINGCATSPI